MLRAGAFMTALVLYALFSAPTPDHIGIAEGLVAAGLMAGIGVSGILQSAGLYSPNPPPLWYLPARLLLLFGLSVPVVTGLAQGHELPLMARDVISFLFLMLPLFLSVSFTDRPVFQKWFPFLLCTMGLIFAGRVMGMFLFHMKASAFTPGFMPDPDNLVNAPIVLFASLFLTGIGGLNVIKATGIKSVLTAGICSMLTLILLVSMAGVGQRAHMGAWVLTVLFWMILLVVYRPLTMGRFAGLALLAVILFWPVVTDIAQSLAQKNTIVGLNNRVEEARVIWASFHGRPLALIGGQGWGATIVSPAVGPHPVNYTHSLLTTYLLKTGLAGLVLVLTYLVALGAGLWRILWVHPVAALSMAAPFVIDITLYASFKTLDFGLLLTLIALWTRLLPGPVKVARTPPAGVCRTVTHY